MADRTYVTTHKLSVEPNQERISLRREKVRIFGIRSGLRTGSQQPCNDCQTTYLTTGVPCRKSKVVTE